MMFYEYYKNGVSEICHDVKQYEDTERHDRAVRIIAVDLAKAVCEDDILIPAPQHEGCAVYTREISVLMAKLTGAAVCDILRCKPHKPLYEQKLSDEKVELELYVTGMLPKMNSGKLFFVDNVIATGKTFRMAEDLIKGLRPLVYAVDYSKTGEGFRKEYLHESKTGCVLQTGGK